MLKKWFIGLSLFSVFIISGTLFCLHFAYDALLILIQTGFPPPYIIGDYGIPGLHDIGVGLSFFGLVALFGLFVWVLRNNPAKEVSPRWSGKAWILWNSDFYYIVACFGIFVAWLGIWVCMHQAFLYELEASFLGRIPEASVRFLIFNFEPVALHNLGFLFVTVDFLILMGLIALPKFVIYRIEE